MKHRHRLQQQRHKAPSRTTRDQIEEAADEQPSSSRAKKRIRHQEMAVEGKRPRVRLDKYSRGSRRPKRFDDGGVASGSTRGPNDPGGELDAANKGRKSTLDWIKDEIMGGTRPAYKHGGRQRSNKYDIGGAAPPGGVNFPPAPTGKDFITTPRQNPVVAFVQKGIPPMDRFLRNPNLIGAGLKGIPPLKVNGPSGSGQPGAASIPNVQAITGRGPPAPSPLSQQKAGGRIHKNPKSRP